MTLNLIEKRIKRGGGEYIIRRNVEINIAFSCLTVVLVFFLWRLQLEGVGVSLWKTFIFCCGGVVGGRKDCSFVTGYAL